MSEPIREQLARVLSSLPWIDGNQIAPFIHPSLALVAADAILARWVLSEVGGVETKLPLDPEPYVCKHGVSWSIPDVEGCPTRFAPSNGYSQDEGDYR